MATRFRGFWIAVALVGIVAGGLSAADGDQVVSQQLCPSLKKFTGLIVQKMSTTRNLTVKTETNPALTMNFNDRIGARYILDGDHTTAFEILHENDRVSVWYYNNSTVLCILRINPVIPEAPGEESPAAPGVTCEQLILAEYGSRCPEFH